MDYNILDGEIAPGSCAATCFCLISRKDAFSQAVEEGREDEVHDMLRRDVRLMKRRGLPSRRSAWHIAAAMGHTNVLKTLVDVVLSGGANVASSLRRMLAMSTTSEELLKGFLLQGSGGGLTPLMLAARAGHGEAVAYLLSIGEVPHPRPTSKGPTLNSDLKGSLFLSSLQRPPLMHYYDLDDPCLTILLESVM